MRILALLVCGSLGCASITASQTEGFAVSSIPSGAEVRLNGAPMGVTPTRIEVPRRMGSGIIEVSREGYRPRTCPVSHSPGGGYVAADVVLCILFFPIGCVSFIDANGAWNELVGSSCSVSLEPIDHSSVPAPPIAAPPPKVVPPPPQKPPEPAAAESAEVVSCKRDNDCGYGYICEAKVCVKE